MTCILALDQGTSSSRALIFDESGGILATVQQPTEQIYPRPGWVEQDPEQIWATQREVARQALAQAGTAEGTDGGRAGGWMVRSPMSRLWQPSQLK